MIAVIFLAGSLAGCRALVERRTANAIPYSTQPIEGLEISEEARAMNRLGIVAFNAGRLGKAEAHFRGALDVDVGFGPAHNNLGQIYLARHQLYLAAWEFEYAANLMPELPEPLVNQGLAYETGEQIDRAAEIYYQAYERFPRHPVVIASLARTLIKQDGDRYEIAALLDELIMRDGRQDWVEWAKELRSTKYRNDCLPCQEVEVTDEPWKPGSETAHPASLLPSEEEPAMIHELNSPERIEVPQPEEELPWPVEGETLRGLFRDEGESFQWEDGRPTSIEQASFDSRLNAASAPQRLPRLIDPRSGNSDSHRSDRRKSGRAPKSAINFNNLAKEIQETRR